jgi:hypothetical protein
MKITLTGHHGDGSPGTIRIDVIQADTEIGVRLKSGGTEISLIGGTLFIGRTFFRLDADGEKAFDMAPAKVQRTRSNGVLT